MKRTTLILILKRLVGISLLIAICLFSAQSNAKTPQGVQAVIDAYGSDWYTIILLLPKKSRPIWFRRWTERNGCATIGSGYDYKNCWYTL